MFTKEDEGSYIEILNNLGSAKLVVGNRYMITAVIRPNVVVLDNDVHWTCNDKAYSMVFGRQDTKETMKLKVGDKVILKRDTTTGKKGQTVIIEGFLDDQETKLSFEGSLPGGWIEVKNVYKVIDLDKYRLPTIGEIMYSDPTLFKRAVESFPSYRSYGNSLANINKGVLITQKDQNNISIGTGNFPIKLLKDIEEVPMKVEVCIAPKDVLIQIGYKSDSPILESAGMRFADMCNSYDKKVDAVFNDMCKNGGYSFNNKQFTLVLGALLAKINGVDVRYAEELPF